MEDYKKSIIEYIDKNASVKAVCILGLYGAMSYIAFNVYKGIAALETLSGDSQEKICQAGYTDVFRSLHPDKKEYTWWTYAYNARQRNIGWRIDYFFASNQMLPRIKDIIVEKEQKGSDHCPITLYIR